MVNKCPLTYYYPLEQKYPQFCSFLLNGFCLLYILTQPECTVQVVVTNIKSQSEPLYCFTTKENKLKTLLAGIDIWHFWFLTTSNQVIQLTFGQLSCSIISIDVKFVNYSNSMTYVRVDLSCISFLTGINFHISFFRPNFVFISKTIIFILLAVAKRSMQLILFQQLCDLLLLVGISWYFTPTHCLYVIPIGQYWWYVVNSVLYYIHSNPCAFNRYSNSQILYFYDT